MAKLLLAALAPVLGVAAIGCGDEPSGNGGSGGTASGGSGGNEVLPTGGSGGGMTGGQGGLAGDGGGTPNGGTGGEASGGAGGGDADGGNLDGGGPDIDLTLGGLNDDLPPPSHDCVPAETPPTGCVAFSGEYNGTPFDLRCDYTSLAYVYLDRSRRIGCEEEIATGDVLGLAFSFTDSLVGAVPGAFELWLPPDPATDGFIGVYRQARLLSSYEAAEDQLVETHVQTFRAAAHTDHVPGLFGQTSERSRGTFAVTIEPRSTCVPDQDGFGCDHVRLRGNFNVRSIPNIAVTQ